MLVPVDPTGYLWEKIRCIFSQARIQTLFNAAAGPVSWLVRLDSTGCNVQKDPTGSTGRGQTRYLTDVFPAGSTDMFIKDLETKQKP